MFEPTPEPMPEPTPAPGTVQVSRRALIAVTVALVLLLGGAIATVLYLDSGDGTSTPAGASASASASAAADKSFTITGTYVVNGACGQGGFSDIKSGTQIQLVNQDKKVLRKAELEPGGGYCKFNFTFYDVPTGHELYGVQVGNDRRGVFWQDEAETKRRGFQLQVG